VVVVRWVSSNSNPADSLSRPGPNLDGGT
jgi:hypothetical protein